MNGLGHGEQRIEQSSHHEFGHHIGDAHDQLERMTQSSTLHRIEQFPAQREDLVRVTVNDAAGLGEFEAPAASVKKRLTQRLFKPLDLGTDRGMGQVQDSGSGQDPSFPHHNPEVHEMMVVKRFHGIEVYVDFIYTSIIKILN